MCADSFWQIAKWNFKTVNYPYCWHAIFSHLKVLLHSFAKSRLSFSGKTSKDGQTTMSISSTVSRVSVWTTVHWRPSAPNCRSKGIVYAIFRWISRGQYSVTSCSSRRRPPAKSRLVAVWGNKIIVDHFVSSDVDMVFWNIKVNCKVQYNDVLGNILWLDLFGITINLSLFSRLSIYSTGRIFLANAEKWRKLTQSRSLRTLWFICIQLEFVTISICYLK